ncbi:MAG: hypothetical protein QM783_03310 [Phycisphaerales bacterium]
MKRNTLKLAALSACVALIALAGCNRPLLSPQETRSPFDSYDSVRGQYAAQKSYDYTGAKSRTSPSG